MMPDQSQPFHIETDASKYATGAVLTQLDSNGDRHPVSFIAKTFSPAERNYEIYDHDDEQAPCLAPKNMILQPSTH